MEASGENKTRSREFQILSSLHTKRQRVAAQSVADSRVTYIGPDHRDRWVRFN